MRLKRVLPAILAMGFVALVLALCWPSGYMVSRDIGCDKVSEARGRAICKSVSESMEWTWMGHAIVSPGWRPTWNGLRRVYCREKVTESDLATLDSLKRGSDWRLESAADDLIRLVTSIAGTGSEPENSIFNPKNTDYILKAGCRESD